MTCLNCGANNIDGSSFCVKCGANLKGAQHQVNVNNEATIKNEQPIYNQQPVQNEQPMLNQLQNNYQEPMNNSYNSFNNDGITNNKKEKNKLVLVIIIIIIIIVILGIVTFFCFKKDKSSGKDFDINYSTSFFIRDKDGKYA